jgi:hypothetical protein
MIHIQAIQLTSTVEIPSSGSARVKDENMAMIEMAVANKNGRKFFISAVKSNLDIVVQKSIQVRRWQRG